MLGVGRDEDERARPDRRPRRDAEQLDLPLQDEEPLGLATVDMGPAALAGDPAHDGDAPAPAGLRGLQLDDDVARTGQALIGPDHEQPVIRSQGVLLPGWLRYRTL